MRLPNVQPGDVVTLRLGTDRQFKVTEVGFRSDGRQDVTVEELPDPSTFAQVGGRMMGKTAAMQSFAASALAVGTISADALRKAMVMNPEDDDDTGFLSHQAFAEMARVAQDSGLDMQKLFDGLTRESIQSEQGELDFDSARAKLAEWPDTLDD